MLIQRKSLTCGAINSRALFLRSKNEKHPNGLANSSDFVGKHYKCHQNSAIVALHPQTNTTKFQQTLGLKRDMLRGGTPFFNPNILEAHKRLLKKLKKISEFTRHKFHVPNTAYLEKNPHRRSS